MVKTDFSPKEILWMIRLLHVQNRPLLNVARAVRQVGTTHSNPTLRSVMNYLIETGIVTRKDTIGSSKLIFINHRKLCDLIDEQEYVNHIVSYLKEQHIFSWRPL